MRIPLRATPRQSSLRSVRMFAGIMSASALVSAAACDSPTRAPIPEQRWSVAAETTHISVASLLPSGVSILPDSSGFSLLGGMATVARALFLDCSLCVAGDGSLSTKPALVVNAAMSSSLASDVSAATLTEGSLALNLTNNYTFDPLRPNGNAAPFGTAKITVSNGGTLLGSMTIDGETQSLSANGGKLALNIPLTGGISGTAQVSVVVVVNSPEGTPVMMDASRTIAANGTPTNLKVPSAVISVAGRALTSSSDMDFSGVDEAIAERALQGALLLDIQNPFAVTSTLQVTLKPEGDVAIVKSVTLEPGSTTRSIEFTKEELRQLFGHNVAVTLSGAVEATNGTITVSPKQAVVVKMRLNLTLSGAR